MIEKMLEELIIGSSPVMRHLRETILRVGPTRLPVLILGPTGAGKELVARGLHLASGRSGSFESCNVCALNPSLFESAVFGHVRGAFTGAVRDARGHLADANGGTMFFDEIGGLVLESQAKLLRALDGYGFRPVGATRDCRSDFRLVSATNDDLRGMVNAGRFRADLWYRLTGVTVHVPPLSARLDDLADLSEHFLTRGSEHADRQYVTNAGIQVMRAHSWSGNVRELSLTLERAALFATGHVIDGAHVAAAIDYANAGAPSAPADRARREKLIAAMNASGGETRAAAQLLGVSRPTLYRHLSAVGLIARRWRDGSSASHSFLDDVVGPSPSQAAK